MIEAIAEEAAAASPLWARAVRPPEERDLAPVFGPLAGPALAPGLETIYEGYLLHHGAGRVLRSEERDGDILIGDYLYATGLVAVCGTGDVGAVATLATLISLAAEGRTRRLDPRDDGRLWLLAARRLARGSDEEGGFGEAAAALRGGDVGPLRRLAPDDGDAAAALLDRHAALLGGLTPAA